jgi:eukaryotic-like serine/threonine-protein kinase
MFLLSSGALIDLLCRHGLSAPDQLQQLLELVGGRSSDGRALAKLLVHRGLISRYQAVMLIGGRGDELSMGKYRIFDLLGEGGLSRVFLARHADNDWTVALKVIRPEVLTSLAGRQQFMQEMEAMARLDHPNIVQFLDVDQSGNDFFYAMEYVLGADLRRLVRVTGPLPVAVAANFTRQVALGLQHAHERSLVHRDIKPANLYLTNSKNPDGTHADDNLIKILDWGLSSLRPPGQRAEQEGPANHLLGTIDYMAPEQALNPRAAGIRSDIYSLGCTLYYLLTGQVPFPDGTVPEKLLKHQREEPTPLSNYRKDVPVAFAALMKRMLAKHPEDRFRTPDSLALALAPHARSATNNIDFDFQELVRASKQRGGNDCRSAWTFGSLSVASASRPTLFTPSDTSLPHKPG